MPAFLLWSEDCWSVVVFSQNVHLSVETPCLASSASILDGEGPASREGNARNKQLRGGIHGFDLRLLALFLAI